MRLVVHMGATKTASTYVQKCLARNEDVLRAAGIYLPRAGRRMASSNLNHHNLAWQLIEDRRYKPAGGDWSAMLKEVAEADADLVLLSSEAFSRLAGVEKLSPMFKRRLLEVCDDVTLVYVVRDPLARINSMYSQTVKTFAPPNTFDEYAVKSVKSGFYNLEESFRYWYEGEDVKFVALRFDEFVKEGPMQAMLRTMGVEVPMDNLSLPADAANPSPGPVAVEAMRLVNAHLRVIDPEFSRRSAATTKLSQVAQRKGAKLGWFDEKYWGWDVERAAWAARRLTDSNQRFSKAVWGIDWPLDVPAGKKATAINLLEASNKTLKDVSSYVDTMTKRYINLVKQEARGATDDSDSDADVNDFTVDSDEAEQVAGDVS